MSQLWTITSLSTGAVVCPCFETPGPTNHPKDHGWAWVSGAQKATQIPALPDEATQLFNGASWVGDLVKVKAILISDVKLKNENFVRDLYTTTFGKQKKYSRKQQEVMDYRALAPVTLSLGQALMTPLSGLLPQFANLTASAQKKKFRFAMAEAALRGVGVDVVIGEYETTIETIESKVAAYEAVEMALVRAIKAATSVAAARAAATSVPWTWTPG